MYIDIGLVCNDHYETGIFKNYQTVSTSSSVTVTTKSLGEYYTTFRIIGKNIRTNVETLCDR